MSCTHLLTRKYKRTSAKYGLPGESLAAIGGLVNPGETPSAAAERELAEEVGLRAGQMIALGAYRTDVNRGGGFVHAFLALDCVPTSKLASHDDLERQTLVRLTEEELLTRTLANEVLEVKWTATFLLGLQKLQSPQRLHGN